MPREIKVEFNGVVIDVTVTLDGDPAALSRNASGDKWTGSRTVADSKPAIVDMVIIAPRYTNWAIVLKAGSTKIVDDEGKTNANPFFKTWTPTGGKTFV